jgi:hypothetical protein
LDERAVLRDDFSYERVAVLFLHLAHFQIRVSLLRAASEQIGLSLGCAFRSLRRFAIPSVISTVRPR